jgi:hypothetical protein
MNPPILLSISNNENNTPDRVKDLVKAIESFKGQIVRISDDPKQSADICMKALNKQILIEVKDTTNTNDMWNSKQGHIGDQLVNLLDQYAESFIIVLGSYDECLKEVPQFTRQGDHTKWAGKGLQESNKTTLRALNADAYGSGIPVFYLSKDRVLSFKEALSYGKNRLLGANPFQWASPYRGKAGKIKALMGARGIGAKNAEALLKHFGSIHNLALADFEALKKCPGIGSERAIAILELMR